jgi:hypothetical protein
MRDASGQPLKDAASGEFRYRSAIKWASWDLQQRFSAALIAPIEAQYGPIGSGS